MKTTLRILSFFLILSVFPTCHLERIDSLNEDCPNPPVADFTLSTTEISLGESVTITNQSDSDAATYAWDFGNNETSDDFNASITVTYNSAGTHEIVLVVTDAGGCSATARETITVTNEVKFSMVVPGLGAQNITPLAVSERNADKRIHCIYKQGTALKSVIINPLMPLTTGEMKTYTPDMTPLKAFPASGGFVVCGSKSTTAPDEFGKVAFVTDNQGLPAESPSFQYENGGSFSITNGALVSNSEIVSTGVCQEPTAGIGFARHLLNNGALVTKRMIKQGGTTVGNYSGISIVEKTGGNFFIAADSRESGQKARLVQVDLNGDYVNSLFSLAPINYVGKIIRLNGDNYAVIGRDDAQNVHVLSVNTNGQITGQRNLGQIASGSVVDLIAVDGGQQVVVCGTKSNKLYLAKFAISSATFTWETTHNNPAVPANAVSGYAVFISSDGGYLALGQYNNAGQKELFLAKTDALGKTD